MSCIVSWAWGQITVQGTVTEQRTGIPLVGVTVEIAGTTMGTVTANDGNYRLDNLQEGATLVFRYLGYVAQRHAVPAISGILDVEMEPGVLGLEEVVIVGSRRQGRLVTDAAVPVDVLSPRELESQASTDIDDVLRTQIPSYYVLRHGWL